MGIEKRRILILKHDPLQLRLYYRQMLKCVTKENENVDMCNLPEGWNLCKKTHQLPQSSPTSGRNLICQKCSLKGGGQGFNSFTNVKENKFQYLFKFVRVFLGQQSSEKLQAVQSCLPVNDGLLTLPSTSRYGEEFGY